MTISEKLCFHIDLRQYPIHQSKVVATKVYRRVQLGDLHLVLLEYTNPEILYALRFQRVSRL